MGWTVPGWASMCQSGRWCLIQLKRTVHPIKSQPPRLGGFRMLICRESGEIRRFGARINRAHPMLCFQLPAPVTPAGNGLKSRNVGEHHAKSTEDALPSPNSLSTASTPPYQKLEVLPMCPVQSVTYVSGRSRKAVGIFSSGLFFMPGVENFAGGGTRRGKWGRQRPKDVRLPNKANLAPK